MMSKHTGLNTRSRPPAPARCSAGDPVTPFEHNWILQFNPNNKLCGASLIDAEWAVTAAHCTDGIDASNMKVHVYRHRIRGGDGHECSETLNIDKKFEHPEYDSARLWNDIALLRLSQVHQPPLSRPQKYSSRRLPFDIRPPHRRRPHAHTAAPNRHLAHIWLTSRSRELPVPQPVRCADSITMPSLDDGSSSGAGTTVTVAGWGTTSEGGSSPNVLHSVDLQLLTNAQCEAYGYAGDLIPSSICAIGDLKGGEDACQGDSGGPLFVQQARALTRPPHVHAPTPSSRQGLRGSSPPALPHTLCA